MKAYEKSIILEKLALDPVLLEHQFHEAIGLLNIREAFQRAGSIFIKPNLTYPRYKKGVTTRKEFVEYLVKALRQINSSTKIYIGEGEGGYNSFPMTLAMRDMGFFEIEKNYPNVEIINLSQIESETVKFQVRGHSYFLDLPSLLINKIDFSITCPLPKVHCMTKITLAFKNQWGCLPDVMRLKNHFVFNEIIGQICEKLKIHYAFLDGKYGLDNNGPMDGDPVEVNWFAASNSIGAFDVIVAEMMGFNWKKIGHLRQAARNGFVPERKDIRIVGDINSIKRKFVLKRSFWNYPALAAFRSRRLTHLFYFSKCAKPLHDIMYLFRKRPF